MRNIKYSIAREAAARYGILVADVMDAFATSQSVLTPAIPSNYSLAQDWDVVRYLVGKDTDFEKSILGIPDRYVFYGVLARSKTRSQEYIVVIRGTKGFIEWLVDAQIALALFSQNDSGNVEEGFFSVYKSMKLLEEGKTPNSSQQPAWQTIRDVVRTNKSTQDIKITVIGHSLGAAIACYLTFDLCTRGGFGDSVTGCFLACPRPGDISFASAFDSNVNNYIVYDYHADVIPNLPPQYLPLPTPWPPILPTIPPPGPSFVGLPNVYELDSSNSQAVILDNPKSNHHVLCYSAMLYYKAQEDLLSWWKLLIRDGDFPLSIIGPRGHL